MILDWRLCILPQTLIWILHFIHKVVEVILSTLLCEIFADHCLENVLYWYWIIFLLSVDGENTDLLRVFSNFIQIVGGETIFIRVSR